MIAAREERETAETLVAMRLQRQREDSSFSSYVSRSLWGRAAEDEAALTAAAIAAVIAHRPPEQRLEPPPPAPVTSGFKKRVLLPYQVAESGGALAGMCTQFLFNRVN